MRNDTLELYVKLRRERTEERNSVQQRLQQINDALSEVPTAPQSGVASLQSAPAERGGFTGNRKRKLSSAGRAAIAAAARKRWAAIRTGKPAATPQAGAKKPFSPAARKALAEAARK